MGNNIQRNANHIEDKEPSEEIDDEADNKTRRRQKGNNVHAKIIKFRNRHFHKNKQKKLRSKRDTLYDSTISTLPISNGNLPKHKSYLTLDEIRNIQVIIRKNIFTKKNLQKKKEITSYLYVLKSILGNQNFFV